MKSTDTHLCLGTIPCNGSRLFKIDEAFSTLMHRNLTNVYKQTIISSKWCLFSVDRLLILRMHQLKPDCQLTQQPQIQKSERISKPSPRWPTLHIAHLWHNPRLWNLTEQLVLWSQMVVDCSFGFSWLGVHKFQNTDFYPLSINEMFLQHELCWCMQPKLRYLHTGANIYLYALEAKR